MTQRAKRLGLQFGIALAVCGAIALFDRPLVGLIAFVICIVIFATHAWSQSFDQQSSTTAQDSSGPARGAAEEIVYSQAPHCYNPGNPIYYPPEGER